MAFRNVSLPSTFQFGSTFGSGFNTIIHETATGHETRISRQSQARHQYNLIKALQSSAEAIALKRFVLEMRGALDAWRLKDWLDYSSNQDGTASPTTSDQAIATGDGTTTTFQLVKSYGSTNPYVRTITLPVSGTVVAAVAGTPTAVTVSNPGGVITFASPPALGAAITAGFQFDVPVRFGQGVDKVATLRAEAFGVWAMTELMAIEVLDEIEWPELWSAGGCKVHSAMSASFQVSLAEGELQVVETASPIDVYLPFPERIPGGPRVLVLHSPSTSTDDIQIRNGGGIAGPIMAPGDTLRFGLIYDGNASDWLAW